MAAQPKALHPKLSPGPFQAVAAVGFAIVVGLVGVLTLLTLVVMAAQCAGALPPPGDHLPAAPVRHLR